MKILKIALILLIPSFGIVSCNKSECGPRNDDSKEAQASDNKDVNAKLFETSVEDDDGTTIVGSGDDDRDGGDKKVKKSR
jgi:hypothetical protein